MKMEMIALKTPVIEEEMAKLKKDEYLRPGMSYNDFVGEFSTLLSQSKEDKEVLTGAGIDFSIVDKGYTCMEMLVAEHGERVNAEAEENEFSKEFKEKMPIAKADKKCLMAVGRYIVTRTGESGDKKVYDTIRAGHGDIDTLNDNIVLTGFLRNHKDLATQVKPGGKTIDDHYLAQVEENALNLIKLRGAAITARDDAKEQVDRQNKLITLCIKVQREIKLFAEMAFYDDPDRYDQFYASAKKRQMNKQTQSAPENAPQL